MEDRVDAVDADGDGGESLSFASRIFVGKLVKRSCILSSSDACFLCFGVDDNTLGLDEIGLSETEAKDLSLDDFIELFEPTGVIGLALEMGVRGDDVSKKEETACLLLDLRGRAGMGGIPNSSDRVRTRRGSTIKDGAGDGSGVGSTEAFAFPSSVDGSSNSATGVLGPGEDLPVNCWSAFEGVLGAGDSGIWASMSQEADLVSMTRFN